MRLEGYSLNGEIDPADLPAGLQMQLNIQPLVWPLAHAQLGFPTLRTAILHVDSQRERKLMGLSARLGQGMVNWATPTCAQREKRGIRPRRYP